MSLILDALNRADQQRSEEHTSSNPLHHRQPILPADRPAVRWVIEGVILLLIVGGIVYSQWPSENTATPTTVNPAAFASNGTVSTTTTEKELEKGAISQTPPIPIEPTKPVVKLLTPDPAIPSLYQTIQPDSNKQSVLEPPVQKSDIDESRAILRKIPLLTDRSSRFQRVVPSIDYQVHVYSDKENAGFVNLNGTIHKIGSQIVPGMRVIAILKDSVVLDYQGTQFRLSAMNSWVNYN